MESKQTWASRLRERARSFLWTWKWVQAYYPRRSRKSNFLENIYDLWNERLSFGGKLLTLLALIVGVSVWRPDARTWFVVAAVWGTGIFVALALSWIMRLQTPHLPRRGFPKRIQAGDEFALHWLGGERDPWVERGLRWWTENRLPDGLLPVGRSEPDAWGEAERSPGVVGAQRVRALRAGAFLLRGPCVHQREPMGIAVGRKKREKPELEEWLFVQHSFPECRLQAWLERISSAQQISPWLAQDHEWRGLRPYQRGDRLRDLDSRAWARLGKPVTREFEGVDQSKTLFWVVLPSLQTSRYTPWTALAFLRLASSLCEFLASKAQLGGIGFGDQGWSVQDPAQADWVLKALALPDVGFRLWWSAWRGRQLTWAELLPAKAWEICQQHLQACPSMGTKPSLSLEWDPQKPKQLLIQLRKSSSSANPVPPREVDLDQAFAKEWSV
jgi:hypothetical protein